MKKRTHMALITGILVVSLCALHIVDSVAGDKHDMGGWAIDSPYNRQYNPAELDKIRVTVVKLVEVTPMPGMEPGVGMIVRERDAEEDIIVHICPAWFMKPGETGLKRGDQLKIRGCWTEIGGKDVFMAAKIKKGDYFSLKVRLTKDGTPFWTMSPEQLAQERASE